jgi:acyl-[acyl-carrier-protein]-phospholipid O-acyltransferase/long-chain-fatty-acid--[acyl-carrier-protein] ligase
MSEVFWVKPFLKVVKALPIDPNNSMAIKTLINEVKKNKKIAIFPEGRISTTGSLMKIYEGPGMIADKADATILPIRIDGPQFTHFSKVNNILKTRIFTKVTITILPPVKFTPSSNFDSRERRKYISTALYNVMADMMFESSDYKKTLFQSLIDAAKIYGFNKVILQDVDNNSASYRSLLLKAFILSDLMSKETSAEEFVGLMLPNMVASTIAFYALQASGRIPTMINFTAGAANIISGCRTAMVKTIYSSKKFVKKAELEEVVDKIIAA